MPSIFTITACCLERLQAKQRTRLIVASFNIHTGGDPFINHSIHSFERLSVKQFQTMPTDELDPFDAKHSNRNIC